MVLAYHSETEALRTKCSILGCLVNNRKVPLPERELLRLARLRLSQVRGGPLPVPAPPATSTGDYYLVIDN